MFSRFSVRKPMTVFVSVVVVLVLGIVSFFRMTPDLLPNMDFPYVIIMTTYGGQTPETVETVISKPLEQSLSIIDGVKTISSRSAENYSIIMVEFEDGTNMESATVDVRSGLDAVSDLWPDEVGAPYLIKVNPNILPVAMAAVEFEGKERTELSDFVSSELMNKIEGIDGVASVSDKGLVIEKENIVLSQDKIDELNKKISAALDDQFSEAEDKLNEARDEINNNIEQAKDGSQTISDSMDEINSQQEELAKQLADAQNQASNGSTQILSAKMELLDQKSALTQTKQLLETSYQALLKIKGTYNELTEEKQAISDKITLFNNLSDEYKEILGKLALSELSEEETQKYKERLEEIDKELEPYNVKKEGLTLAITAAELALKKLDSSIEDVNTSLRELGTDTSMLDNTLESITSQISQLNAGIKQIDGVIQGLDDKSLTVNEALATIAQQQSGADFKMSAALSTLTTKQSELQGAVTQLESAKKELEASAEELTDKKSEAKDKADMNNTVTLETIAGILTAQNFSMPAGYVTDDDNNKLMVRVGDKLPDEKSLKTLALFDTSIDGVGVVELGDVADIFVADNSDEIYAKINGIDGVILSFSKQSNIATSVVSDNITKELKALEEKYDGLRFTNLYNQGDYIHIIVESVLQNLLMGAVLAIIILFLFLRDIKPTIIVAVSIPISLIFAIVLMYFSSISLNVISLSGLAIGVGMLVDNSVVVIENTFRLRGLGYSPIKAAMNGAKQVSGAIAASTLTTISVFLPIVFVEGVTRQLFVDMALTIAYSLLASLIVALTLVPAMSSKMLRRIKPQKDTSKSKILNAYEKSLRFTLRHRLLTLLAVIALLFASGFTAVARGFSFMPDISSTEVQISVSLEGNATFEETVEIADKISEAMVKYDEFETVGVTTGGESSLMGISAGGASAEAGSITAYGVLKSDQTKEGKRISDELKEELDFIKGDIEIGSGSMSSMSTLIGDGSVTVKVYGEELDDLRESAKAVAEKLESLDEIDSADNGLSASSPEIRVSVDKAKQAQIYCLTCRSVFILDIKKLVILKDIDIKWEIA
ncbi:MAG: efflux RND transporter permease subunit, partial [Ruminococcus sp.]|nr:efflux RND transporter permease subunit [Ruminococcus sp.]